MMHDVDNVDSTVDNSMYIKDEDNDSATKTSDMDTSDSKSIEGDHGSSGKPNSTWTM